MKRFTIENIKDKRDFFKSHLAYMRLVRYFNPLPLSIGGGNIEYLYSQMEIAFKCLLGWYENTHSLRYLFSNLPYPTRRDFQKGWTDYVRMNPASGRIHLHPKYSKIEDFLGELDSHRGYVGHRYYPIHLLEREYAKTHEAGMYEILCLCEESLDRLENNGPIRPVSLRGATSLKEVILSACNKNEVLVRNRTGCQRESVFDEVMDIVNREKMTLHDLAQMNRYNYSSSRYEDYGKRSIGSSPRVSGILSSIAGNLNMKYMDRFHDITLVLRFLFNDKMDLVIPFDGDLDPKTVFIRQSDKAFTENRVRDVKSAQFATPVSTSIRPMLGGANITIEDFVNEILLDKCSVTQLNCLNGWKIGMDQTSGYDLPAYFAVRIFVANDQNSIADKQVVLVHFLDDHLWLSNVLDHWVYRNRVEGNRVNYFTHKATEIHSDIIFNDCTRSQVNRQLRQLRYGYGLVD